MRKSRDCFPVGTYENELSKIGSGLDVIGIPPELIALFWCSCTKSYLFWDQVIYMTIWHISLHYIIHYINLHNMHKESQSSLAYKQISLQHLIKK